MQYKPQKKLNPRDPAAPKSIMQCLFTTEPLNLTKWLTEFQEHVP